MPASAFLQSNAAAAPTQSSFKAMPAKATPQNNASLAQSAAISGTGTTNFIPLWKSSTALGSSVIYQSANGMLGVGTKTPKSTLDVHSTGTAAKILVAEDSAGNQRLSVDVHGNVNVVTDVAGTATQVKGPLSPLNHARGVVDIQQNQTYAVTLNWSFPFPDTNYTVSCTPVSSGYTGSGEYLLQVTSISPTSVQVEIAAYVGGDISIHCIGVHD
jgi:hypothetical protein